MQTFHHHTRFNGIAVCNRPGCESYLEDRIDRLIREELKDGNARIARHRTVEARPLATPDNDALASVVDRLTRGEKQHA